jgi:hypothetical protein
MRILVTKSEAAAALGISKRQLELYMRAGQISVCRLGRRCVRIEQVELARFVERLRVEQAPMPRATPDDERARLIEQLKRGADRLEQLSSRGESA